jgi:hypothetical protein
LVAGAEMAIVLILVTIERALLGHVPSATVFLIYRGMEGVSIPASALCVSSRSQNASKNHSRKETLFPKLENATFLLKTRAFVAVQLALHFASCPNRNQSSVR